MPRKKRGEKRPALRLAPDAEKIVTYLANATGWSANKALAFLAKTGWNALNEKGDKTEAYQRLMRAAVEHHETKRATEKRLAIASRKLSEARHAAGL